MSKLTRKEQHNAKRARRIAEKGVQVDTLIGADVWLAGYEDESCDLCGHPIKWLFGLRLKTTAGDAEFIPVGSTCITDWAEALPLSDAQRELLSNLALAKEQAEKLKARFRSINGAVKHGTLSEDQGKALLHYFGKAPAEARANQFLRDIAERAANYGRFVGRQWESWSNAYDGILKQANAPKAPKCGKCGSPTRYRSGRYGDFFGCTTFPNCRWTQNVDDVIEEPEPVLVPEDYDTPF